jgi:hypothetical protein
MISEYLRKKSLSTISEANSIQIYLKIPSGSTGGIFLLQFSKDAAVNSGYFARKLYHNPRIVMSRKFLMEALRKHLSKSVDKS